MDILKGRVVSKSITKKGEVVCTIQVPDERYDCAEDALHIKADYDLGVVVEITIYAERD